MVAKNGKSISAQSEPALNVSIDLNQVWHRSCVPQHRQLLAVNDDGLVKALRASAEKHPERNGAG